MKNQGVNLTKEHRALLKQWAKDDDRSMSSVIRGLVDREKERRDQERELIAGAQNPERLKPTA